MAGNDYGQQLRSALDTARSNVLSLLQKSTSQREQGATTLGHAEQTMYVNGDKFDDAQRAALQAEQIFKLSVDGSTMSGIASDLATKASSAATDATTAMSIAATSIKVLADAYDTLSSQAAGINAIAQNDDSETAMSEAARDAQILANNTAKLVEKLKVTSLGANIESARSTAGAALVSIQAMGNEMQALVDRVSALLAAAKQKLDAKRKIDTASEQAEKKALELYQSNKVDDEALASSANDINVVVNGNLTVTQDFAPPPKPPGASTEATKKPEAKVPVLSVQFYFDEISDTLNNTGRITGGPKNGKATGVSSDTINYQYGTAACNFFAVPAQDAPAFSFDAAMRLIRDKMAKASPPKASPSKASTEKWDAQPSEQAKLTHVRVGLTEPAKSTDSAEPAKINDYQTTLWYDSNGHPLALGTSYCVFVLREPKAGLNAANASDLSLPTPPIQIVYTIQVKNPSTEDKKSTGQVVYPTLTFHPGNKDLPKALQNPNVAFWIELDGTKPPAHWMNMSELVAESRAIIMRKEVYAVVKADALFLARLLNPSYYTVFKRLEPQTDSETNQDNKKSPGNEDPKAHYYALFRDGQTDAYGDIIEPGREYVCLALLVGGSKKVPNGYTVLPDGKNTPSAVSDENNTPSVLVGPVQFQLEDESPPPGSPGGRRSGPPQPHTAPQVPTTTVAARATDRSPPPPEARTFISPSPEARTLISPPPEARTFISPSPEARTFISPSIPSDAQTVVPSPSDAQTLVPTPADNKAEGSPSADNTRPNGNKNQKNSK